MILVTGATGQFGKLTLEYLLRNGLSYKQIAVLVRDEVKATNLKNKGIELRIGSYDNYDSLVNAFQGVEKLLFVSGNDVLKRGVQHQNVVYAAKEAGVKHLIYTSFLSKNETYTSPLWIVMESHLKTESLLKESGMNYTILKNTLYMDLIPAFLGEKVLETGVIYLPAGHGKVGAVLRSEMAEASANILTSTQHTEKAYQFTNDEAFSYQEVADYLSKYADKPIQYVSPSADEYSKTLTEHGVPSDFIEIFTGFALAQANSELDIVSSDMEKLLGRKPTSIRSFLDQVYKHRIN